MTCHEVIEQVRAAQGREPEEVLGIAAAMKHRNSLIQLLVLDWVGDAAVAVDSAGDIGSSQPGCRAGDIPVIRHPQRKKPFQLSKLKQIG
jgi:hypothetical protein